MLSTSRQGGLCQLTDRFYELQRQMYGQQQAGDLELHKHKPKGLAGFGGDVQPQPAFPI